jgi:hypothetical protein
VTEIKGSTAGQRVVYAPESSGPRVMVASAGAEAAFDTSSKSGIRDYLNFES